MQLFSRIIHSRSAALATSWPERLPSAVTGSRPILGQDAARPAGVGEFGGEALDAVADDSKSRVWAACT